MILPDTGVSYVPIRPSSSSSSAAVSSGRDDGLVIVLNVTAMRIDPVYSSFVNWSQLFYLGIIPVVLLVYFNTKIYQVSAAQSIEIYHMYHISYAPIVLGENKL